MRQGKANKKLVRRVRRIWKRKDRKKIFKIGYSINKNGETGGLTAYIQVYYSSYSEAGKATIHGDFFEIPKLSNFTEPIS